MLVGIPGCPQFTAHENRVWGRGGGGGGGDVCGGGWREVGRDLWPLAVQNGARLHFVPSVFTPSHQGTIIMF